MHCAADALSLRHVRVLHGRAEDLAKNPAHREKYGLVVSRAVARLNILAELCLPFVKAGGIFAAYKGPESAQEITEAQHALHLLGGQVHSIQNYRLPQQMGERSLIIIEKINKTPEQYPRKAGIPSKKPLI